MARRWMGGLRNRAGAKRAPTSGGIARTMARGLAAMSIVTCVGCEAWGPHEMVTAPTGDPSLTAAIIAPITTVDLTPGVVEPNRSFQCATGVDFTGPIDIAMTAGQDVDLHRVAITLVDETGPRSFNALTLPVTNTFSEDELTKVFGTTIISGGTTKSFRFHTRLPCGRQTPESVVAEIRFIEFSGRKNSLTVTAPFASFIRLTN